MPTILAIDQGTTGTAALIFDDGGAVLARAYEEFEQHFPKPGWVEHDPLEIWDVTLRVARGAIEAAGERPTAIGITNQRETAVLWDRETGEPVHHAIVWQDRRTAERCRELKDAGHEGWVRERTGLVFDAYFSATKFEWLLDHVPGARERAEAGELAAGTIDSWLIWKLTGGRVHATEPTNASRTLLFDIDRLEWDDELLELFSIPRGILPELHPSSGVFGETEPELFDGAIPIAGVAGDQQAALFGQGCTEAGLAKNTYGTGAFLLLNTGSERVESEHGLLTTVACDARGQPCYALEGSIFVAGAAVQWLRDELGLIATAPETETLAASLSGNDDVYFVPAFTGLGAPHWEPEARGTIFGLTRGTGREHLVRAALEAIAYSSRDVLEAMQADSGVKAIELGVDGGAAQNDWLMRFQADIIGLPVHRPALVETTALGAAGLAGIATGVWTDATEFQQRQADPQTFEPEMQAPERQRLVRGWHRAVDAARAWATAGNVQ